MARGSGATLRIKASAVPLLTQAQALVDLDFVTGASHRNWDSCSQRFPSPTPCRWRCGTCSPTRRPPADCWCRAKPRFRARDSRDDPGSRLPPRRHRRDGRSRRRPCRRGPQLALACQPQSPFAVEQTGLYLTADSGRGDRIMRIVNPAFGVAPAESKPAARGRPGQLAQRSDRAVRQQQAECQGTARWREDQACRACVRRRHRLHLQGQRQPAGPARHDRRRRAASTGSRCLRWAIEAPAHRGVSTTALNFGSVASTRS